MRPGEREEARRDGFRSDNSRTAPGIHQLVADALREASTLAGKEFELFRREMSHNAKLLASGIFALVVAAVFGIGTLILLTDALVDFIAVLVDSEALAALIVAGVTLVFMIIFLLIARSRLAAATLEPRRTINSIERDSEILSQRMNG